MYKDSNINKANAIRDIKNTGCDLIDLYKSPRVNFSKTNIAKVMPHKVAKLRYFL